MADEALRELGAYVEYLRDLGVHDLYRRGEAGTVALPELVAVKQVEPLPAVTPIVAAPVVSPKVAVAVVPAPAVAEEIFEGAVGGGELAGKLVSFNDLAPLPESRVALAHRPDALKLIQEDIGDCTRCPLAYAGRRKIVFADGDPGARLMFVGEGPGADEDTQGLPFVGKAGQLLNNMISAMGLKREEVYIANIVKCRPPGNRTPEPVEANTCSQFLLRQMDVVQPEVVVALGSTAATYLLGVKQSLAGLRGRWHSCRGAKLAVTYHPAFLLRDPRMKGEAWKDLQMVMKEMGLKAPAKA
jgi:DNA polymerase